MRYLLILGLFLPFSLPRIVAGDVPGRVQVATEPTDALRKWENLRYGMFIHFGLSTFSGNQFGRIPAESTDYAPTDLDVDQWILFEGTRYYIPNEVCDSLGQNRWFWGEPDDVRPARQMIELYRQSVGRGSNLLLNTNPDRSGRIPPETVRRLKEIAELIEHPELVQDSLLIGCGVTCSNVYHNDLKRWSPEHAIDMDITAEAGTRWATDDAVRSAWLEVNLGGRKTFARATISEFLDSIRAFELQIPDGEGGWKAIHRGKTIGGPGLDISFDPVTSDRIRLAITEAVLGPTIWDFALYPPR